MRSWSPGGVSQFMARSTNTFPWLPIFEDEKTSLNWRLYLRNWTTESCHLTQIRNLASYTNYKFDPTHQKHAINEFMIQQKTNQELAKVAKHPLDFIQLWNINVTTTWKSRHGASSEQSQVQRTQQDIPQTLSVWCLVSVLKVRMLLELAVDTTIRWPQC